MNAQNITSLGDAVRVAYVLPKLRRWVATLESNAAHYKSEGRAELAFQAATRAQDFRDIIAMLDGTEDEYIAGVRA